MKQTPKSCGCMQCRSSKTSGRGNCEMKQGDRHLRRQSKQALKLVTEGREDDAVILPASRISPPG